MAALARRMMTHSVMAMTVAKWMLAFFASLLTRSLLEAYLNCLPDCMWFLTSVCFAVGLLFLLVLFLTEKALPLVGAALIILAFFMFYGNGKLLIVIGGFAAVISFLICALVFRKTIYRCLSAWVCAILSSVILTYSLDFALQSDRGTYLGLQRDLFNPAAQTNFTRTWHLALIVLLVLINRVFAAVASANVNCRQKDGACHPCQTACECLCMDAEFVRVETRRLRKEAKRAIGDSSSSSSDSDSDSNEAKTDTENPDGATEEEENSDESS